MLPSRLCLSRKRHDAFDKIVTDFLEKYDAENAEKLTAEELEEKHALAARYYDDVLRDAMRRCILDEGKRLDGRKTTKFVPFGAKLVRCPCLMVAPSSPVAKRKAFQHVRWAQSLMRNGRRCTRQELHAFPFAL